ncbi:hypothetical protein ACFY64_03650 [Streptomyces collinus]|uniref:hypothetical protein n=1 Tax=Streptomyces collinus TaxID=42684 RepID=UPI003675D395
MIAHLQHASHTVGLLEYLYGPGERGNHTNPRLIAGDGHGAPIEMLAQTDASAHLAHALDAPVERLGARAPQRPVWVCSVRSDPRHPDPTDAQWAEVARRIVAATGIAPEGDPDACRWGAVRNQARQVHVVATLAREDGSLHNTYRDAFRLQTECHRIATERGHLPPAPRPTLSAQETHVPAPYITISAEPSGSVSAKGASDDLSATLLKHAGFQQIEDWYGRRHRLATTTPLAKRVAIASHAAELLRAARYSVDLDPDLDTSRLTSPANPLGLYTAGAEVLRLTDQIRAAENGAGLAQAVDHLLHPEHGVLERLREALERGRRTDHRPRRRGVRARRPVRLRRGVRQRGAIRTRRSGTRTAPCQRLAAGPRRGADAVPSPARRTKRGSRHVARSGQGQGVFGAWNSVSGGRYRRRCAAGRQPSDPLIPILSSRTPSGGPTRDYLMRTDIDALASASAVRPA